MIVKYELIAIMMIAGILASNVTAATWQGGTNDWASDNWGLDTPDGYPGDANYVTELSYLNNASASGEAQIKAGDYITNNAVCLVSTATIKQSGGIWINNIRIDLRTRLDLLGGTLTSDGSFRVAGGGVWNIDGGELGTRITTHDGLPTGGNADLSFTFRSAGGSLIVSESGIVDVHTIDMSTYLTTAGGIALVEAHGVVGDKYDRATLFWKLKKHSSAASATAKFVFSTNGISPWIVLSNNALDLGIGADRGLLDIDVSAFNSDGTNAYTLIDYAQAIQGDGTFGDTNVVDDVHGVMSPGTAGSLQPGEYFLDYAYGGDKIAIYFNNPLPAAGTVVIIN